MSVAGPLIPYIDAPELPLAFLEYLPIIGDSIDPNSPPSIKPFGTLVALGVYIGSVVALKRARQRGLDTQKLSDFLFWSVASGFVISHILDAIAYHPDTVWRDPLYLLRIWDGLSSYGGLIGGVIGGLAWSRYRKENIFEYLDVCISAFPLAWVFGRSGCSVVHDHPGALSNAWFAVKFPAHTLQAGFDGRFDLGLMEMVLTIPLAIACHLLWRRKPERPAGFYIGVTLLAYAPVRFGLDFLRVEPGDVIFRGATDPRYMGLTPAQWVCFAALAIGIFMMKRAWGKEYVRTAPLAPPEDDEELDEEGDDDAPESDKPAPKKKRPKRPTKRAKKKRKKKAQSKRLD